MKGNVNRLALFHHDPERTDEQLDEVKGTFKQKYSSDKIDIFPAYEKLEIEL